MTTQNFPRNTRHEVSYYKRVLLVLLSGLHANHRQAVIATMLDNAGVPSATGGPWTEEAVKALRKRLRNRVGPAYVAMLQLVFDRELTREQVAPLFTLR